jgi:predicted thioesterase
MSEITIGLTNEKSVAVTIENTAVSMGSGTLRVFATPAMIALCEGCCAETVEDLLGEGMTSVGTKVDIEHIASSPVGAPILCRSTLTAVDGRKLEFEVEVYDNEKLIGKGKHTRFIVNAKKFFDKTYANVKKRITE